MSSDRRTQARRHLCTWAALLALLAAAPLIPGCIAADLFGALAGDRKVPARHELADRPTLVFVEDPDDALGSRSLRHVVAANVGHHLVQKKVLSAEPVSPRRVSQLAEELGSEFDRLAIDEVGRRLGAEQVIHVLIESATLEYHAAMVLRPRARAQVRVIDAVAGRRVFPAVTGFQGPGAPPPGEPVTVQMQHRGSPEDQRRGRDPLLHRALAERLGLQVARLFFDHRLPERGEGIGD